MDVRGPSAPISRRGFLKGAGGLAVGATLAGCASNAQAGSGGPVTIELWHGQNDVGRKVIEGLVADFQRAHPGIRVDMGGGVLADAMLQKVTAALASGSYPDIAYVFGADLASVARSPQVVDVTGLVNSGPTPWPDYWPSAREAVTLNGRVRAVPAMLDVLAVVCNKTLFAQRGIPLPDENWTWPEFVATARKLTDPQSGTFGTAWPGAGDEDTVWRLWPLVWDLGGEVIGKDGRSIGFAESGVRALEVLRDLAADKSVYIDPKPGSEQMYKAFAAGRIGMVATGPWQLPDITDAGIDYHVVPLPTFSRRPVTISGPDTWTLFDNGEERVRAARTFVSWLIQPDQDVRWDVGAGSLPLSRRAQSMPAWQQKAAETAGLPVFAHALENARVKPVHPAYPQVSQAVATAVVAVLLGRSTPAEAMRACAEEANAALIIPR
ncbi:substrate-binding domain-containing protein [Amycolatopsis sp. NPDC059021]|uniref:substrate-binding domain-containing protein n=1 Tax=Amycolatopsis sp. NPDC059021 TaxID=3346704 RepID=UPI00366B7EC0